MFRRPLLILSIAFVLPACGGGSSSSGGGGGPTTATTRLTNTDGCAGLDYSDEAVISADGTKIAFRSAAGNLVPNDTNGIEDIFLYDRTLGTIAIVSVSSGGIAADVECRGADLSADGRYVVFATGSSGLIGSDTNGAFDIYLRDTVLNITSRVSVADDESQALAGSEGPSISADGRYVVFESTAANLVAGDGNGMIDIFIRDTVANTTVRVSVADDETESNNHSYAGRISGNGLVACFDSDASDLIGAADTNSRRDVFVRDLAGGTTTRVSVSSAEVESDDHSFSGDISSDGSFVAFTSDASNLVAGDSDSDRDIFVRNLTATTTVRCSVDTAGTEGNGTCEEPAISPDGRYVVFMSSADNLVAGDLNAVDDIFLRDTTTNVTTRVSVSTAEVEGAGDSFGPSISNNGTFVVFASDSDEFETWDTNNSSDVYLRDGANGTTTHVSNDPDDADEDSHDADITPDGRYVVFESFAANLIAGDTNGFSDIFRLDTQTGTIIRVSLDSAEVEGDGDSQRPSITPDGRYVAFMSFATDLVASDTNNNWDVFVRDIQAGTTIRVSVSTAGVEGGDLSSNSRRCISSDGRYVTFHSQSTNLVASDNNAALDVFVRDTQLNTTTRASVDSAEVEGDDSSSNATISADGRYIAFESFATDLVAGDTNVVCDVFVRDTTAGTTTRVSVTSAEVEGDDGSYAPSMSSDGAFIAFESDATDLVAGDTNGFMDIFVRNVSAGTTTRISVSSAGVEGDNFSTAPCFSPDGTVVAFDSEATNLVAGDTGGYSDIFMRNLGAGTTSRVSVATDGTEGDASSWNPGVSNGGAYVVFEANAANFFADDLNDYADIFRRGPN